MTSLVTGSLVPELLVPLLVKSSLVLLLAALVALVVDRAAAATRHRVWAAAFAALALLPVLVAGLPGLEWAVLPAAEPAHLPAAAAEPARLEAEVSHSLPSEALRAETAAGGPNGTEPAAVNTAQPASSKFRWSAPALLFTLYLAGVGVLLAWLALGVTLVRRWIARGTSVTDDPAWSPILAEVGDGLALDAEVELVLTSQVRVPMVWMPVLRSLPTRGGSARRATVLLPEAARGWSRAQRRDTLVHELAHVERLDGPVQLAARLVCVAYWFHPLAWLALARLRLEAERACDDRVLATGSASCDYAERLVALARGAARLRPRVAVAQATVALSGRQQLARRVHALLDAGRRRVPAGPLATALLAAAVLLPALALAPVRLVEAAGAVDDGPFAGIDAAQVEESAATGTRTRGADARGSMPDALSPRGLPPLMAAVADGDRDTASRLLAEGADPDAGAGGRGTPLILAAAAGDADLVERLLAAGADPNGWENGNDRPDDLPRSPLGAAARSGDRLTVERLLAAGAEVDGMPRGDATPLMIAARHGHPLVARRLVDAGADVDIAVKGDGTPLIEAVRGGDQRVVDLLLERGADPAVGVPGDGNPLIWAVVQGDRELVQRLVDLGADPDAWVPGDESAFFHAVESGDGEMVALLLDAGADPDPDFDIDQDLDVDFDADTDHDVDVDVEADTEWRGEGSPLIVAAGHGDLESVDRLLAAGADPDGSMPGDGSPLIRAASAGHLDVVDRLLAAGADIDLVVPGDETALIQAAGHGHLATVRHLVERGADVDLGVEVELWRGGREVRTPLSQARRGGHDDVILYLRSQGARR